MASGDREGFQPVWQNLEFSPLFSSTSYDLCAELATAWSFVAALEVYNNNSVYYDYYDLYTFHYSTVYVLLLHPYSVPLRVQPPEGSLVPGQTIVSVATTKQTNYFGSFNI